MTQRIDSDDSVRPELDTSRGAQRARLLARLQAGPIDTIAARRELNVMAPAPRIKELREAGHSIKTHLITVTDDQGRAHQGVALYHLSVGPAEGASA